MTKQVWFVLISLILVLIAGIICFKNLKNLRRSIYWLFYPNIISVWSKKIWGKDFEHTFRFELFIILGAVLVGVNYLIFKHII